MIDNLNLFPKSVLILSSRQAVLLFWNLAGLNDLESAYLAMSSRTTLRTLNS